MQVSRAADSYNRKQKRPTRYDGKTGCRDYLVQFDLVAALNMWDDHTKVMELATSLEGAALSVLADLSPEQLNSYQELVKALLARFEPENQSEAFRARLKGRVRKATEPLTELSQEIKRLVRKAYPEATPDIKEVMARDAFVDSLNDADLEWSVFRGKPKTLDEAVTLALEHEAFQMGRRRRTGGRQLVRAQGEIEDGRGPQALESLDEIVGRLAALMEKSPKRHEAGNQPGSSSSRPRGACHHCGKAGHYVAECRKREADRNKTCPFCSRKGHSEENCWTKQRMATVGSDANSRARIQQAESGNGY